MKIYIGNLSKDINDTQLREMILPYGEPVSAAVATERGSGASRGFGFVELSDSVQAAAAIAGLNGKEMNGQPLTVNEARPKGSPAPAAH